MLTAVLLAGALLLGAPAAVLAVVALGLWSPALFLLGVVVWAVAARVPRGRVSLARDEAVFLQAVAGELQAGSVLRAAVVSGAARVPGLDLRGAVRRAEAGRPATDVADALGSSLPVNGRLAAAAYRLAAETGGRAAGVFGGLAARATDRSELDRERRSLTAPARTSAVVVGTAPVVLLAVLLVTGHLGVLVSRGLVGIVIVAVGVGLQAAGAVVVWWMMRPTAT
jgi:Flp pilus assembly protein TadB